VRSSPFLLHFRGSARTRDGIVAPLHHATLLVIVWLAMLLRGLFYCVEQPIWEGFDEWAHFAYIQHIAECHSLPPRTELVSSQIRRSLKLVPLSRPAAEAFPGAVTHEAFWHLPAAERIRRRNELFRLSAQYQMNDASPIARQYEAQQPPLYYVILAPVYLLVRPLSLPSQVLALRIVSLLIVSSIIFLGSAIALRTLRHLKPALFCIVILAVLPGLDISICRIGNDTLAIAITSAVVLYALKCSGSDALLADWLFLGTFLGAGLLTKAYVLALLPLLPITALIRSVTDPHVWKRTAGSCLGGSILAVSIGGWWYWNTWQKTGTISGEMFDLATSSFSVAQKLSTAFRINWLAVADAGAFSHIWVGGWSFLLLRSWMYRVFEFLALLAGLGLFRYAARTVAIAGREGRARALCERVILVVAYALMTLPIAYHSVLVFLIRNIPTAIGWYLYPVAVPEVVLLILGFRGLFGPRWSTRVLLCVCILVIALDLYTVQFLLMPYYSGMIVRRASGSLDSISIAVLARQMGALFQRISIDKPAGIGPGAIAGMWIGYICSTAALGGVATFAASAPNCARLRRRHPG